MHKKNIFIFTLSLYSFSLLHSSADNRSNKFLSISKNRNNRYEQLDKKQKKRLKKKCEKQLRCGLNYAIGSNNYKKNLKKALKSFKQASIPLARPQCQFLAHYYIGCIRFYSSNHLKNYKLSLEHFIQARSITSSSKLSENQEIVATMNLITSLIYTTGGKDLPANRGKALIFASHCLNANTPEHIKKSALRIKNRLKKQHMEFKLDPLIEKLDKLND